MALQKKILIVEDEEILAENLLAYLRRFGWEGRIAPTAGQAVAAARVFLPAVLLLDYHLPDRDGFAALAAIRRIHGDCPCLLMTADPTGAVLDRARRHGIRRVLGKPFSLAELLDCLAAESGETCPAAGDRAPRPEGPWRP